MRTDDLVQAFLDHKVNMSTIFEHRYDFTKDELARLALELYYSAYSFLGADEMGEFETDVGTELKDYWE